MGADSLQRFGKIIRGPRLHHRREVGWGRNAIARPRSVTRHRERLCSKQLPLHSASLNEHKRSPLDEPGWINVIPGYTRDLPTDTTPPSLWLLRACWPRRLRCLRSPVDQLHALRRAANITEALDRLRVIQLRPTTGKGGADK